MEFLLSLVPIIAGVGIIGMYIGKIRSLLKEIAEVLVSVDEMMADNQVTKEELAKVKKEAIDVWTAVKAFAKK